jgi:hypothetical protein
VSVLCVHIDLNLAIKTLKKSECSGFGCECEGGSLRNSGPLTQLPQLFERETAKASSLNLRRFASVSCAASLAFTRVLALATSVAGFAAALALTIVLAFARVLALFRVSHRLEGDARITRCTRCIGTHGDGPS